MPSNLAIFNRPTVTPMILTSKHHHQKLSRSLDHNLPLIQQSPPLNAISSIKSDIQLMREDIQLLYKINRKCRISAALYKALQSTFRCRICKNSPIVPQVIFEQCCKSIIGCQGCADRWYRGDESKPCPLCGTPRALPDTMRLHGLDEFLLAIEPLLNDQDGLSYEGDQDESPGSSRQAV